VSLAFGFRGVTRMSVDVIDGILLVGFVIIVLAVIERRRAGAGRAETAKSALGKWSRLLENVAKCVVVAFGIIFIVAVVLLLYLRG
jgi:Trk-type K+ transport system membrane component